MENLQGLMSVVQNVTELRTDDNFFKDKNKSMENLA